MSLFSVDFCGEILTDLLHKGSRWDDWVVVEGIPSDSVLKSIRYDVNTATAVLIFESQELVEPKIEVLLAQSVGLQSNSSENDNNQELGGN